METILSKDGNVGRTLENGGNVDGLEVTGTDGPTGAWGLGDGLAFGGFLPEISMEFNTGRVSGVVGRGDGVLGRGVGFVGGGVGFEGRGFEGRGAGFEGRGAGVVGSVGGNLCGGTYVVGLGGRVTGRLGRGGNLGRGAGVL